MLVAPGSSIILVICFCGPLHLRNAPFRQNPTHSRKSAGVHVVQASAKPTYLHALEVLEVLLGEIRCAAGAGPQLCELLREAPRPQWPGLRGPHPAGRERKLHGQAPEEAELQALHGRRMPVVYIVYPMCYILISSIV